MFVTVFFLEVEFYDIILYMKKYKEIGVVLIITLLVSVTISTFGNKFLPHIGFVWDTGCFENRSLVLGWPNIFYESAGEYITCGEGVAPSEFDLTTLIDNIAFVFIPIFIASAVVRFLYKKIRHIYRRT